MNNFQINELVLYTIYDYFYYNQLQNQIIGKNSQNQMVIIFECWYEVCTFIIYCQFLKNSPS